MTRASEDTTATAAIDADTIHRTSETVLWSPRLSREERDVAELLVGQVNLLQPEVHDLAPRALMEQLRTTVHVIGCTRRTLHAAGGAAPADDSILLDMAPHCRALLALYPQLSASDDRPVHVADGGRQ
ncbi:hypothetical protein ACFV2N_46790 [Streptomyces sp. NPDC059680]|uniref:hypothetical protein n=1 Tax=Streptomyces sp. NPDC059680 TaxID=3346904 RepID=UPI0036D01866